MFERMTAAHAHHVGRTTVTALDLNQALRIYLGADAVGGVRPYGMDDRIRSAYGPEADRVLQEVREILAEVEVPDELRQSGSLTEIAAFAERHIRLERADLNDDVCRAVGNYVSYSYR